MANTASSRNYSVTPAQTHGQTSKDEDERHLTKLSDSDHTTVRWVMARLVGGAIFSEEFAAGAGAVGIAGQGKDFGVMHKAVDHGSGHHITGERLTSSGCHLSTHLRCVSSIAVRADATPAKELRAL